MKIFYDTTEINSGQVPKKIGASSDAVLLCCLSDDRTGSSFFTVKQIT